MNKWYRFIRPMLFFAAFLSLLLSTKTLLWMAFLLLFIFYFNVDVLSFDKRKVGNDSEKSETVPYGILGNYVVDATKAYGLFIKLCDVPVFVDIRPDSFADRREQQALYLFENREILEVELLKFMNANPEFKNKKISFIGLHSRVMDQGEVFWDPDGHTLVKGINFVL